MRPLMIAPYLLRSYIWQVLKTNTDMDEDQYGGKIPIVPLAEEPELEEYDFAHIVYGYAENPTHDLSIVQRGNMSFVVYDTNFRKLSEIINVIARAFDAGDESARRINEYTSTIPQFLGLRFGYTEVTFVEGGSPETTEGGRQSAAVNIRYEYYVDYDVDTKLVDSTWP